MNDDEAEKMECVQLFEAASSILDDHSYKVRENVIVNMASSLILERCHILKRSGKNVSEQAAMDIMAELAGYVLEAVMITVHNDTSYETVEEILKRARRQ